MRVLGLVVVGALTLLSACGQAQTQDNPPWHLDRVDQRQLPLEGRYEYASTGEGVRVYIVDDGVKPHADFADRLVTGLRLHGPEPTGDHGTRAAGAAAGARFGVAKEAQIVDVHVYDDPPDDDDHAGLTAQGYEWIIDNHPEGEPGVVVNAWGLTDDVRVADAVREMLDAGISLVQSAGNLDEQVGMPGALPLPDISRNQEMIVVGATTHLDHRWTRSSYGPHVDIYGPGADLTLPSGTSETASGTSGTSWAAPIVAGVVALLLEADPDLSAAQVKEQLLSQATKGAITRLPEGSHNRLVYSPVR